MIASFYKGEYCVCQEGMGLIGLAPRTLATIREKPSASRYWMRDPGCIHGLLEVEMQEFSVGARPVSRGEWLTFARSSSSANLALDSEYWNEFDRTHPYDDDAPIVTQTYLETLIFCWIHGARLPKASEWTYMVRGPVGPNDLEDFTENSALAALAQPFESEEKLFEDVGPRLRSVFDKTPEA